MRKKDMRKDKLRVEMKKEASIIFGVCRNLNKKMPEKVYTKNISKGGLCIVSDTELPKGAVLGAEIAINSGSMQTLKAYCEAVWSRKDEESDKYLAGLQFIGLKPSEERNLEEFLKNYILN